MWLLFLVRYFLCMALPVIVVENWCLVEDDEMALREAPEPFMFPICVEEVF